MVDWLLHHGTRIAFVVVLALAAYWLARRSVPRAVRASVPVQAGDLDEGLQLSPSSGSGRRRSAACSSGHSAR